MQLLLKDFSEKLQTNIRKVAELENGRTGYDMKLEDKVSSLDTGVYYHMSKKLDYGDYTVEIRNQGDCKTDDKLENIEEFYAYEAIISSKTKPKVELRYKLSHIASDLGCYDWLPTWETLQSILESDEINQFFKKYREMNEKIMATIKTEFARREDE